MYIYIYIFYSLVVLSSDDEDRSSEPKEEEGLSEPKCMEKLQDNITDVQEIEQQSDVRFSEKLLEDNVESHTEQVVQFFSYILLCQTIHLFIHSLFLLVCCGTTVK